MAVVSPEYKKCPRCKTDKWLKDFSANGYCTECQRLLNRLGAAKQRRTHREEYNEYHRLYRKRRVAYVPTLPAPKG